MATYVLAEYEQEEFNKPVPAPRDGAGRAGSAAIGARPSSGAGTARLSPFNMPDQVTVLVEDKGDEVRFAFGYPNDEPAERSWHPVAPGISLRIGRLSGKVLEVAIRDAATRFQTGPVSFDPSAVDAWVSRLPADRQFACQRNAQVVATIMSAMPDHVRRWVLDNLRRVRKQHSRAASVAV